ncbi:MAG: hypothetical protein E7773_03055 [Sphingomonas sp.]|uniref:hypothetical protein n=1 Tax=Sphingomonas sp. TaxID=28214 RepID=UPI00121022EE|nr:hypothetical protein [Sphingomonas sp.]THD37969.1 MAG: hypothetical protein E7773_03055 [Sphingomonas sp.]
MDEVADLQAQIVALRLAVEGAWLSLLNNDPDPAAQAGQLKEANIAAVSQLDASTENAAALRNAVALHTAHLWSSIEWQLQQAAANRQ